MNMSKYEWLIWLRDMDSIVRAKEESNEHFCWAYVFAEDVRQLLKEQPEYEDEIVLLLQGLEAYQLDECTLEDPIVRISVLMCIMVADIEEPITETNGDNKNVKMEGIREKAVDAFCETRDLVKEKAGWLNRKVKHGIRSWLMSDDEEDL